MGHQRTIPPLVVPHPGNVRRLRGFRLWGSRVEDRLRRLLLWNLLRRHSGSWRWCRHRLRLLMPERDDQPGHRRQQCASGGKGARKGLPPALLTLFRHGPAPRVPALSITRIRGCRELRPRWNEGAARVRSVPLRQQILNAGGGQGSRFRAGAPVHRRPTPLLALAHEPAEGDFRVLPSQEFPSWLINSQGDCWDCR